MKVIVALDFSTRKEAFQMLQYLNPEQWIIKIGLEMFCRFGPDFVSELEREGYKIFLDLKFHDIPTTVTKAVKAVSDLNIWMLNVHASGGIAMMKAAKAALGDNAPFLVAVTLLTSVTADYEKEQSVLNMAINAREAGLDGIVCAATEVPLIKKHCGSAFLTVTPGIRLAGDPGHDQSRVSTPEEAIRLGSDYLVIGRSITASANPQKVLAQLEHLVNP